MLPLEEIYFYIRLRYKKLADWLLLLSGHTVYAPFSEIVIAALAEIVTESILSAASLLKPTKIDAPRDIFCHTWHI